LLPSFIHTKASQGTFRTEICTAFGVKTVEHKLPGSPDSEQERSHCAVCTLSDVGILTAKADVHPHFAPVVFRLLAFAQDPVLRLARASLHLRGPPHLV
jgi:hypothetical protein